MKCFILVCMSISMLQGAQKSRQIIATRQQNSAESLLCRYVIAHDSDSLRKILRLSSEKDILPVNAYFNADLILAYARQYNNQLLFQIVTSSMRFKKGGWTLLSLAVIAHYADIIKILISHGADLNAQDDLGWTALTYSGYCYMDAMALLVARGCNDSLKTTSGKSVIDIAFDKGLAEKEIRKGKQARIKNVKKISQILQEQDELIPVLANIIIEYVCGPSPRQEVVKDKSPMPENDTKPRMCCSIM